MVFLLYNILISASYLTYYYFQVHWTKAFFDRWVYNAIASNNIYFLYITICPQTFKDITKNKNRVHALNTFDLALSNFHFCSWQEKHSDVIICMLWYFKEIDWNTILFIFWIQKTFTQNMDVHRFTGHPEVLICSFDFCRRVQFMNLVSYCPAQGKTQMSVILFYFIF